MATDWTKTINDQYKNMLDAQKTKLDAAYQQNKTAYNKQLSDLPGQYQGIKNEAYANNALAEQARKENMANMGLSGAGGTSQTLQQRNQTSLLNTLGDAARQEQDYTDNINLALGSLTTQYNADTLSAEQQNAAELSGAIVSQGQWLSGHDLSQQQLDLSRKDSAFNQAWSLYQKRLITKKQFEQLTGYKLK